jgi:hypothetical protein
MKYLIIILLLFLIPVLAHAGSSSVSKSSFKVQGTPNSVSTERISVTNNDISEQKYELTSEYSGDISISPEEFKLNPGKSQDVVLRFRQPNESGKTQLSLLSFDLPHRQAGSNQTSLLKVGNGIKLPVEFITSQVAGASTSNTSLLSAPTFSSWNIVIYFVDAILIVIASLLITRRKFAYSRAGNYKINFV